MAMTSRDVIMRYFGRKPGQNEFEFVRELNELSYWDELELADLAAQMLGIQAKDALFPVH